MHSTILCHLKSGQQDLNLRPLGPQPSALPNYAIPRNKSYYNRESWKLQQVIWKKIKNFKKPLKK